MITEKIQRIVDRFANGRTIELVEQKPEDWTIPNRCFDNATEKVKLDGGAIACGYVFWRWCQEIVDAVPHVIRRSPEGRMVDVSRHGTMRPAYHLEQDGNLLFVLDDEAAPIRVTESLTEYRHDGSIRYVHRPGDWACPPSKSLVINRKGRRLAAQMSQADYIAGRELRSHGELAIAL